MSFGVARQYKGTAGKKENAQVGVVLVYASRKGAAFVERSLYLPREWTEDAERRSEAGVPQRIRFVTNKGELAKEMPAETWQKVSAGRGSKGERLYDWACVALSNPESTGAGGRRAGRWLLVRRQIDDPSELAYYLAYGPKQTPTEELIRVAGRRWAIEDCFEQAKGEVGLDEYEVRKWDAWYRHVTLSLLAHAYLAVLRSNTASADKTGGKKGMVALS